MLIAWHDADLADDFISTNSTSGCFLEARFGAGLHHPGDGNGQDHQPRHMLALRIPACKVPHTEEAHPGAGQCDDHGGQRGDDYLHLEG